MHAATVLLPTRSSLEIETTHFGVIYEALMEFTPSAREAEPMNDDSQQALTRLARRHSTNDLIGVEEPLFAGKCMVYNSQPVFFGISIVAHPFSS